MSKLKHPKSILITGATSGIGKALAENYASPNVTLYLSGRNAERLKEIVTTCEKLGAKCDGKVIDVADKQAMQDWIVESHDLSPLDLVIANAGISAGSGDDENFNVTRDIFMINLVGVLNTVHPAIQMMRKNKVGHIAMISSMAGYRGLPGAPAYSASKCAVKAYGEALRGQLAPENINVTVVCPGFVKSGITDANNFPMPFFMETQKAAHIIQKGLAKNKALIAFPWQMRFISYCLSILPSAVAIKLLGILPKK